MENQITLPAEVAQIAESVSVEKRNEVQTVLNQVFNGVAKMREQLDGVTVSDPNDKVNMKLANTIRLGVRQVRLDAEKTFDAKRTEVQAQMLSYKTEDQLWLKAKQTMQILTKEIEEQARWKEETRERFETEQKELKIQQRIVKVQKFAPEMLRSEFEGMSDETFDMFLAGIEKAYNDKIEAERKAEENRIAKEKTEAEERERVRLENIRLKKEAEEKEKALEIERKKQAEILAKQKAESDAKAKLEAEKQAKIQAELNAKIIAERKELEAKVKKEAEEKEKIAAELEAKNKIEAARVLAEQIALIEKEKAEKLAQMAPDKEKLTNWVNSITLPSLPVVSDNLTPVEKVIEEKFNAFKAWAVNQIKNI